MNTLAICNENDVEPMNYVERLTVKAVIVNDRDEVLLFSEGLPGGGVEDGETNEEALARECMEEVGATIKIIRELGNVIAYRDIVKRKYIFTGYHCTLVSLVEPTTTIDHEKELPIVWKNRNEAIIEMEQHIVAVKNNKESYQGDRYQRHIFNTEAAILFLKQTYL